MNLCTLGIHAWNGYRCNRCGRTRIEKNPLKCARCGHADGMVQEIKVLQGSREHRLVLCMECQAELLDRGGRIV